VKVNQLRKRCQPSNVRGNKALVSQAGKGLYRQTREKKQRNKVLVLTLVYTGIRKSELLKLVIEGLDFNRQTILIRQGKGRKDRVIPMAERIIVPLRQQCAGKTAQQRVFEELNERSVYRIIVSLARACGLDGFHPHSFRHYFATRLVEAGINLRDIQILLGHQDLNTTAQYLDVVGQRLRFAMPWLEHTTGESSWIWTAQIECVCYHPLYCFNQFGGCEGAVLRPGNVHSAEGWREALEPIFKRYGKTWIKEGRYALNWTRLSCHRFVANQARLQLFILAYNLGNFLCRLCLPKAINDWSLRSLQLKLIKIGGRIVRHARQIIFQLAEVAVPRDLFAAILERITRLCLSPG